MSSEKMDWRKLLNDGRRKPKETAKPQKADEHRIELERDYDRILFSTPVRRLADKTQVFPLDRNDSVRTRLTHSHEVANLARSIGTALVYRYPEELKVPDELKPQRSIPALLGAIGLAHDLGNPPFGHQGEEAIRSWIKKNAGSPQPSSFHIFDGAGLSSVQQNDFLNFEGNAQSFRLLTKLQIINDGYGLNMSYAFLAALMKYPVASDKIDDRYKSRKKFNFFQSEADIARDTWTETGLQEGVRHPLTYIMEACDDVAYLMLDIEDAAKKGLISFYDLLTSLWHDSRLRNVGSGNGKAIMRKICREARRRDQEYRELSLSFGELCDISMQMLRVRVIGVMVNAVTRAFIDNIEAIMTGQFNGDLISASDCADLAASLKSFAKKNIYSHRSVLEVELKGHRTIHTLMDMFWKAVRDRADEGDFDSKRSNPFLNYVYSRISENYRRAAKSSTMPIRYRELQLVTDMIAGMTDSYAISLLRELEEFHG